MCSDWEDDNVGYGRPPRWTRFEKGRSGNPKGRPRKVKDSAPVTAPIAESPADRALRRELDRKIRITDANGTKEETMADAVVRMQVAKAAQGHVPAIRDVRRAQKELEKAEAEQARLAAEQAAEAEAAKAKSRRETFEFICDLKETQAAAWASAIGEGKTEPDDPWPHPDDIILDHANLMFRIRGPIDEEQLSEFHYYHARRDQYFAQMVLLMRAPTKAGRARARVYAVLIGIYESMLPKRWTIGDDIEWMAGAFLQMPLRFLREDLACAERKADMLLPPSLVQPIRQSESYAPINKAMKPLLKQMGYVSLAQFERAFEDTGGSPPWPHSRLNTF